MARKIRPQKKRVALHKIQCERCELLYCRNQEQCAFLEFQAIAAGTVHECPDYQAPWYERVCA